MSNDVLSPVSPLVDRLIISYKFEVQDRIRKVLFLLAQFLILPFLFDLFIVYCLPPVVLLAFICAARSDALPLSFSVVRPKC